MKGKFIAVIAACVVLCMAGAFRGCEALESVYFAETEGWTADGEPIDPAVLADPAAAAKALTETYAECVLERK